MQKCIRNTIRINPPNKISVIGNPSLAEVKTMMIGVRNNSRTIKSAEVWVNELRLTEFNEDGGWAAQGNLNLQLSDIGSINLAGLCGNSRFRRTGTGVSERRLDDYYQYSFTTTFDLGRFFPKKAKLAAPIYFSYSKRPLRQSTTLWTKICCWMMRWMPVPPIGNETR